MATSYADIIAAAMIQIDDVRLNEQMQVSPALYYRRMSAIIGQALPLLSRPPELLTYLQDGMTEPDYDDFEWVSTDESTTQETAVDTGKIGYDLCSCVLRVPADNGTVNFSPYAVSYDAETGVVTFPQQSDAGLDYELDFYTDGSFPDLTPTQMRLFALAIAVVWDERFSRTWIAMFPKIADESFKTVNEANWTAQVSKRLHDNRIAFNDELRWYEQQSAYHTVFQYQQTRRTLNF